MSEIFEDNITNDKVIELTDKLINFYKNLETVQDYFLERKKEKIANLDHSKYVKLMFDDYSIEPKNMDFEIEVIDGKLFNPAAQIIISLPLESQIGRQVMIAIKEVKTNKYVGFVRLSSPVLSIKPRNDLFDGLKITANEVNKYMVNGAIIVPVQPFGYNYLGGKLLALICCSHEVREIINKKYNEKVDIVFMETTSLYGDLKGVSQYDGLKPFIRYGSMTESNLFLFPNDNLFIEIRDILRSKYGRPEWDGHLVDPRPSGPKMREYNKMISILKSRLKVIDKEKYEEFNEFTKTHMKAKTKKRYYYSNYGYDNVPEYISSDGKVPLIKRDNWDRYSLSNLIEWWKNKAQSRYEKLKNEEKVRHDLEIYTLETIERGNVDMVR